MKGSPGEPVTSKVSRPSLPSSLALTVPVATTSPGNKKAVAVPRSDHDTDRGDVTVLLIEVPEVVDSDHGCTVHGSTAIGLRPHVDSDRGRHVVRRPAVSSGLTLTEIFQLSPPWVGGGAGTWSGAVGVSTEHARNPTSRTARLASSPILRVILGRLMATLLLPHRARE